MKCIKIILLILFLFATSDVFAQTENMFRIIITKTHNKNNLPLIYEHLKKLGIKQFISRKNGEYFIYSQEFYSRKEAQSYLQLLRKSFPSAKILQKSNPKEESNFGVGVLLSYSGMKEKKLSYGYEYGIAIDYSFNKSFFTTLDISSSKIESYTLYNVTTSINYLFASHIFVGVKGGYSILDVPSFSQSKTTLLGGDIGYRYKIDDDFTVMFAYSFLYGEHILQYTPTSQLKINHFHSFACVVTYNLF